MDIDPAAARFGAKDHHVVGDARCLAHYFPPEHFDVVVLNGVFGFGVDDQTPQNATLAGAAEVMKRGGELALGWSNNRMADPINLDAAHKFTAHDRVPVPGSSHVFDFLHAPR